MLTNVCLLKFVPSTERPKALFAAVSDQLKARHTVSSSLQTLYISPLLDAPDPNWRNEVQFEMIDATFRWDPAAALDNHT